MTRNGMIHVSDRWFRLLQRFYPVDFRDEMGDAMVETYRDRAREALARGGVFQLAAIWCAALVDSVRNGPGERARPAVSWRRRGNWGRDAELAVRRLLRAPAFVLATAGTLTIGLGMVAVVYTVVHKILIAPMPYKNPDDLYYVWRDYGPIRDVRRGTPAGPDIVELQKASAVIEDAAVFQRFLGGIFSLREDSDPSEISAMVTSPQLFDMLGVRPMLGRGFERSEVGPGRPNLIVLSYELWNRSGADPALVGKDVRLNGNAFKVIGVLPPDFDFVRNAAVGAPQRADAYTTDRVKLEDPSPHGGAYSALIRARPGSSPEAVAAAVDAAGKVIDARDFNGRGLKLYAVGLKADLVARARPVLLVLAAAGVLMSVMLMVNLASVLLARAAQRQHEYAVSRALGANGAAVVRATLLEGGLLGLIGGAAGALIAIWGTRTIVALAPLDLPRRESITVDWSVAAVVVGLGVALGLLAAIAPAAWAARAALPALLASSAVRGGGGGHSRLRRSMIVAQIALSLVLLSSGGLVVRSFEHLLRADPGFNGERVLTMRIRTPPEFFPSGADVVNFQDRVERALASAPGAISASATTALPLTASAAQAVIRMPTASGNTGDPEKDALLADVIATRASYVDVMRMRLVAGRRFDETRREGAPEALIDRLIASRFFPKGDALGASVLFGKRAITIVGVVEPARMYDVHQDGRPQVYVRAEDLGVRPLSYVVRTGRDPNAMIQEVRAAVRQVDRRVAVGDLRTMDEILEDRLRQQRTSAVLIAAFALGALLLAAMGLFGVVSGSVTRRRHELAVRLALGADHGRVLRLVLAEGALLVAVGVLVGLPALYAAGSVIRGILVGVSPLDPLTLIAVAAGLGVVTMIACYVPARRVLGIDPVQALRDA
jgi:putative ABC transport system permease protein